MPAAHGNSSHAKVSVTQAHPLTQLSSAPFSVTWILIRKPDCCCAPAIPRATMAMVKIAIMALSLDMDLPPLSRLVPQLGRFPTGEATTRQSERNFQRALKRLDFRTPLTLRNRVQFRAHSNIWLIDISHVRSQRTLISSVRLTCPPCQEVLNHTIEFRAFEKQRPIHSCTRID